MEFGNNNSGSGGSWDQWAVFVKETLRRLDVSLKEISDSINDITTNFSVQELRIKETKDKIDGLEGRLDGLEVSIDNRIAEDRKNRTLVIVAIIAAAANILVAFL